MKTIRQNDNSLITIRRESTDLVKIIITTATTYKRGKEMKNIEIIK